MLKNAVNSCYCILWDGAKNKKEIKEETVGGQNENSHITR